MTSERKAAIREHMESTHGQIIAVLDKLTEDQWSTPVYSGDHDTTWSVRDIIAHLADSTKGQLRTAKMISTGENPVPPDFDLTRWNKRAVEKSAEKSNVELAATVRDNFDAWLTFLDEIPDDDLDREGRHPAGENLAVEKFFRRFSSHEANHAADIEAALA